MSEQTVSWRTKQISSVCRELKQELHDILIHTSTVSEKQ